MRDGATMKHGISSWCAVNALLLVLILAGCGDDTTTPATLADLVEPGAMAGRNVLLVTLDTTRPDHLGCYGDAEARTPTLDGLASRGVLVEGAVTPVPVTLPAHASLLTGLYPPRHGVRDNGRYALPRDGAATLAEQLSDAGYATAAVIGCFVLDARYGLDRGFDHYDFQATAAGYQPHKPDFNERDAREVTDAALAWLDRRAADRDGRPFFLWVHYFDPHLPYRSPLMNEPDFANRPYAAEVAHMDAHFGRLLARIDRSRTLIVVAGDHGESLGDHGEPTHGLFLYESTVRVPLILAGAGLPNRPVRLDDRVVSLVDVRPTLEDLLGLPRHEPCDGVSLLAEADPARAVYLETEVPLAVGGWSPLYALRTRDEKFVLAPRSESYDLAADPAETHDRRTAEPDAGAELESRLATLMSSWGEAAPAVRNVTEEEARRLASLGYVTGAGGGSGERPDPKDMMPVLRLILKAEELYAAGRPAEAIEAADEALRRSPGLETATRVLAFSHLRLGDGERAVAILSDACERQDSVYLARSLVQVLIREERYDEAEAALDSYAALAPDDGRVEMLRGDIRARTGDVEAARLLYQQARDRDANRVGLAAEARLRRLAGEG